jgi:hypothetical protein
MGLKREDRPVAFAGRSEPQFFASSADGIPLLPAQASILSHSRAPSTPPSGHPGKESEKAAGKCVDTLGGKQCDPFATNRSHSCRVDLLQASAFLRGGRRGLRL